MTMNLTLPITGMTCGNCAAKIQKRLAEHPEIESVTVTLQPPAAAIRSARALTPDELNTWLAPLGHYRVSPNTENQGGAISDRPAHETSMQSASHKTLADHGHGGRIPPLHEASTAPSPNFQSASESDLPKPSATTYKPLLILLVYLIAVTAGALVATGGWDSVLAMRLFMGGFFIAFSFFKMLDLRGFADAYRGYDIIAKAWPGYGYLYPFIELGLGLAYIANADPRIVNAITALVMAVSLIGVLRAVLSKTTIRCACLGTVFQLPMSTVTIIEDGLMLAMAVTMLLTT
jgi:copper chaperone CopZ